MLKCNNCGSEIPDTEEKCLTCNFYAGPPNVRRANRSEDLRALDERYQRAFEAAKAHGYLQPLERFDEALQQTSAVINTDLAFLDYFIRSSKTLYAPYERSVEGRIRKPAAPEHERERLAVGAILFGRYAPEIIYAALSLNGCGLKSYGPYAMKLKDIAVSSRATVLENNSYDFIRKHNLKPGDRIPPGRLASWDNRHKLGVAKLAERIRPDTAEAEFARLLLFSEGNRATDEFIEVHIYQTFDTYAVKSIKGSSTISSRDEQDLLRILKQHLKKAGIDWEEEE